LERSGFDAAFLFAFRPFIDRTFFQLDFVFGLTYILSVGKRQHDQKETKMGCSCETLGMKEVLRETLTKDGISKLLNSLLENGRIDIIVPLPDKKEYSIYNFSGGAFIVEPEGNNFIFTIGKMR
jgi:hypothetical protein